MIVEVSIPHWFDYSGEFVEGFGFVPRVSIPHWFDYSFGRPVRPFFLGKVSIPHWFDYSGNAAHVAASKSMFQFHTGSITAPFWGHTYLIPIVVSIPHWFDYSCPALRENHYF